MRKTISTILAIVMLLTMLFCFTSCGDSTQSSNVEYTADNPLVIKLSYPDSESNVHRKSYDAFKEYVEEKTGGKVEVEIYANGILGGDQEVMQMVATNEVQIAQCGTSVFACIDDKFCILDLPFLFTSYETMNEAVT